VGDNLLVKIYWGLIVLGRIELHIPEIPFKSQVNVAARTVAFSSPTPYAFNMACAANAATIEEQNAWADKKHYLIR
jgi:hypothetical protein